MKCTVTVIVLTATALAITLCGGVYWFRSTHTRVETSFATAAALRYHWIGKRIDATITNANDVNALKGILTGWAHKGVPYCEVEKDVSLKLSGGGSTLEFRPSMDETNFIEVRSGTRYVGYLELSAEQMNSFRRIVRKYGVDLPFYQ